MVSMVGRLDLQGNVKIIVNVCLRLPDQKKII